MQSLPVIIVYLCLLLGLALFSKKLFRGTSKDYFVASHSIGPVLLLMSVFGTTMTAFALVGSTGKSFQSGVGVYGLMASSSGLIHAACFFLIGIKLWAIGKRHGYVTQIQFFRARFDSSRFGYLLFPILVLLVIPYLLIGIMGSYKVIGPLTADVAAGTPGIPNWLTGLVICGVVLTYIFAGGSRAAAWANTFQTIVFMVMGVLAFYLISQKLGGLSAAIAKANPGHLVRDLSEVTVKGKGGVFQREIGIPPLTFLTYMFIPLSVGMFPHLFQHWLTAKSARTFKLTVIAHPIFILIVWVPCVLMGLWASNVFTANPDPAWGPAAKIMAGLPDASVGAVLSLSVKFLIGNPLIVGLITAGILAAIMSSLDSQFLCLGTMFTNDVVLHASGPDKYTDKQTIFIARAFIVAIVASIYGISLLEPANVFDMAVWSFSGFASLTPLVIAAIYWKGATKAGAYASVLASAGTWLFFFQKSGWGGEYTVGNGIMPVALCFGAGALAMIVVSLVSKKPSDETIAKFFP